MLNEPKLKYRSTDKRRKLFERVLLKLLFKQGSPYTSLQNLRFLALYYTKYYEVIPDTDLDIVKVAKQTVKSINEIFDRDTDFVESFYLTSLSMQEITKYITLLDSEISKVNQRMLTVSEFIKIVNSHQSLLDNDKPLIIPNSKNTYAWQSLYMTNRVQSYLVNNPYIEKDAAIYFLLDTDLSIQFIVCRTGLLYVKFEQAVYCFDLQSNIIDSKIDKFTLDKMKYLHHQSLSFSDLPFEIEFDISGLSKISIPSHFNFDTRYLKVFDQTLSDIREVVKDDNRFYRSRQTGDLYFYYCGSMYRVSIIAVNGVYVYFTQEALTDILEGEILYRDVVGVIPLPSDEMSQRLLEQ